jgi:hypothetical protein
MLSKIFGPKMEKETGDWRTVYNEEIHNLHSSPNISRMIKSMRMKAAGHVECMRKKRNAFSILVAKSER